MSAKYPLPLFFTQPTFVEGALQWGWAVSASTMHSTCPFCTLSQSQPKHINYNLTNFVWCASCSGLCTPNSLYRNSHKKRIVDTNAVLFHTHKLWKMGTLFVPWFSLNTPCTRKIPPTLFLAEKNGPRGGEFNGEGLYVGLYYNILIYANYIIICDIIL